MFHHLNLPSFCIICHHVPLHHVYIMFTHTSYPGRTALRALAPEACHVWTCQPLGFWSLPEVIKLLLRCLANWAEVDVF
jgi:hypothetical protein